MIITTSEKRSLRLTRDQLAVIAHKDPESTKQLERLFSLVNGCCAEPTTASVVLDIDLEDKSGVVDFTRTLEAGRYLLRAVLLTQGSAAISIMHSASLIVAPGWLSSTIGEDTLPATMLVIANVGPIVSQVDTASCTIDGVISVVASGTITVRVSGSGTLLSGSYFSAERLT